MFATSLERGWRTWQNYTNNGWVRPWRVYGIVPEAWNDYKEIISFIIKKNAVPLQRQSPKPPRDWRCKLSGGNPKTRQP